VLTFEDPRVLAQINSVFVTLESSRKVTKEPGGKRILFAFLGDKWLRFSASELSPLRTTGRRLPCTSSHVQRVGKHTVVDYRHSSRRGQDGATNCSYEVLTNHLKQSPSLPTIRLVEGEG
jgi:hypothetical protein